jgi:anti-sigma-K factor RskA
MNDELEFLISQYADGTLGDAESRALEARLAEDGEARAELEKHRRVIGMLREMPTAPQMQAVQWDRLAARIESAVARAPEPAEAPASYRLFAGRFAWGAVGLAASVLIAVGVMLHTSPVQTGHGPGLPIGVAKRFARVIGPRAQVADGPAMTEVSIGPGKGVAADITGDGVTRHSSVLVASGAVATDDTTPQMPF